MPRGTKEVQGPSDHHFPLRQLRQGHPVGDVQGPRAAEGEVPFTVTRGDVCQDISLVQPRTHQHVFPEWRQTVGHGDPVIFGIISRTATLRSAYTEGWQKRSGRVNPPSRHAICRVLLLHPPPAVAKQACHYSGLTVMNNLSIGEYA